MTTFQSEQVPYKRVVNFFFEIFHIPNFGKIFVFLGTGEPLLETHLDIQQRINKSRGAFFRLKNVWRASNISLHLKIKLFNACVKSVMLYGCETWFVTNKTTQKLQAFVNRCLRNILGIWWPRIISNQELWEKTWTVRYKCRDKKEEIWLDWTHSTKKSK